MPRLFPVKTALLEIILIVKIKTRKSRRTQKFNFIQKGYKRAANCLS